MKFGKRLIEEEVEQWKDFYVNYKRLKKFIHSSPLTGVEFSEELFRIIGEELERAGGLFKELLEELHRCHDELLEQDPQLPAVPSKLPWMFNRKRVHREKLNSPREGLSIAFESSTENSMMNEIVVEQREGFVSKFKKCFLKLIGDSQKQEIEEDTPRARFLEWHSSAHMLQHFAELNLEAIRKSAKKLRKYRRNEGDFTISIEAEISRSQIGRSLPRLHVFMTDVDADYERKFGEALVQFKNITINQTYHAKWRFVFLSAALFWILMFFPILESHPSAHNCVALFGVIISLWITEAIPFFCTAMLIPIIAVPLGIITDPATHRVASTTVASRIILSRMMDHVQILVLGGLTIGKALGRTHLEVYAAGALYRLTAHRPSMYLLGVMLCSSVLCAFVSNIAAPLLVLGVIRPTLWEFPEDTEAPHAILLGLAFACDIGGMLSPIASPQNAVALSVLSFHDVSFLSWVTVALPLVLVGVVASWAIILLVWKPFKNVSSIPLQVVNTEGNKEVRLADQVVVVMVSLITVVLWVLPPNLLFGDTGVVALIPIVVFFGIGILAKEDFNTLSWHLMFLLAGGNMLGLCARDSKMLDIIADSLHDTLVSQPPYTTLVSLILVVGVVTTFVSHTVAAMILLPMILKIGLVLPKEEGVFAVSPFTLVFLSALMCSGAMAFPISSFPNVNSLLAEDSRGRPYLKAKDFLFCGTIITFLLFICFVTWMVPFTYVVFEGKP
ncbi:sodium/sulphate symporter, putative [Trypanosoma brucei brucei TREU927]|uniref:Sodium/sulphate symporter, putative n=1 Tax=Trypanosoma brucei brucei (strain 927/4 GUTat10.1) TaxID=185431 RepID=Q383G2_TRYB2|nr:sodium/sulphate symporter, putative [Trypanosoma brucei brucei TREU927]EAN80069.1 sodium/sulphate symporter, putative [Trypanosoma brucei brucei TREU927]